MRRAEGERRVAGCREQGARVEEVGSGRRQRQSRSDEAKRSQTGLGERTEQSGWRQLESRKLGSSEDQKSGGVGVGRRQQQRAVGRSGQDGSPWLREKQRQGGSGRKADTVKTTTRNWNNQYSIRNTQQSMGPQPPTSNLQTSQ